jgi:hypothetical protein
MSSVYLVHMAVRKHMDVWHGLVSSLCSLFASLIGGHVVRSDRLCRVAVRALGYRSRGPGSIPAATRFPEKQWVWNGVHSAS